MENEPIRIDYMEQKVEKLNSSIRKIGAICLGIETLFTLVLELIDKFSWLFQILLLICIFLISLLVIFLYWKELSGLQKKIFSYRPVEPFLFNSSKITSGVLIVATITLGLFIFLSNLAFSTSSNSSNRIVLHDPVDTARLTKLYREAIKNSCYPTTETIDTNLIKITPDNRKVKWKVKDGKEYFLAITLKYDTSHYVYGLDGKYNTGSYENWITAAPELLDRVRSFPAEEITLLRIKQLLGLAPQNDYRYFVEFWVNKDDIFRPCMDQEVDDDRCELCDLSKKDLRVKKWVDSTRIQRYYSYDIRDQNPWTEMGYTYDWNPDIKNHRGLSEFVINKNSEVFIKKIYTTEEYLNKKD